MIRGRRPVMVQVVVTAQPTKEAAGAKLGLFPA